MVGVFRESWSFLLSGSGLFCRILRYICSGGESSFAIFDIQFVGDHWFPLCLPGVPIPTTFLCRGGVGRTL